MNSRKAAAMWGAWAACLAIGGFRGEAAAIAEAVPTAFPEATPAMQPETPEALLKRLKPRLEHDADVEEIKAELGRLKVPAFEVKEVTAKSALERINDLIAAHNAAPGRKEEAVAIPPVVFDAHFRDIPANGPAGAVGPLEARVTVSLTNSRLPGLLRTVTQLAGLSFDVQPDGIWVRPPVAGMQTLTTRRYRVPERMFADREAVRERIAGVVGTNCRWEFDGRTRVLTLTTGNLLIGNFETWYARALLER